MGGRIVGVSTSCGTNWVNRQVIAGESERPLQYRHPPLLWKLEPAVGTPTLGRWVHEDFAGGDSRPFSQVRRFYTADLRSFCDGRLTFAPMTATMRIARKSGRGCSSAGRARRSQRRGRGFEPLHLHHMLRRPYSKGAVFCAWSSQGARTRKGGSAYQRIRTSRWHFWSDLAVSRHKKVASRGTIMNPPP